MQPGQPAPAPSTGGDAAPAPAAPAPAPAATPAPAAPAAPATNPTATPAPGTPPAPAAPEKTAEELDDDEWADAENEIFPGLKSTQKKEKPGEQAKPQTTTEETTTAQSNPDGKEPNAQPGAGDDTAKQGDGTEENGSKPDPAAAEESAAQPQSPSQSARDYARQLEATKADVMKQMFADIPDHLQDADGDPIRDISDVMKLINPKTNEPFTDEEAGMWLLSAQQQFNQQRANIEKQAEQIADVNLEIKEQADRINAKYGEFLKANTDLRDELWAEFQETLVRDDGSQVITKMPVSLEKYYERALAHRVEAQQQQATAAADAQAQAMAAEEQRKKDEVAARQQKRADRSDIYAGNQPDPRDDEDKEWDEAHKAVFGK